MSALDFSEVKKGTYVKIGTDTCKSISIDGVKAWEYQPAPIIYDGNPDDYVGKESQVSGYSFNGSSFFNSTLSNYGTSSFFIKSNGNYSYPVGQTNASMRDEEYFLTLRVNVNESPHGTAYTKVDVPLKFGKKYKKVEVPYDTWNDSFSGGELSLTISFGNDYKKIDCSDGEIGEAILESATATDTITFEFSIDGSFSSTREIKDWYLIVDTIFAYE